MSSWCANSKPYAFEARPWELKKTESIDVMDAVGSNIRVDTYGWEVKRILPRINNAINEEWISDKTRYACDGLLKQRLDSPYLRKNGKLSKCSWDEAINTVSQRLTQSNKGEIGGHVGDLVSLESIFSFKNFLNFIGCSDYDFREKNIYFNTEQKINYLFNTSIEKIDESDLILLIGCNPRHEATILNARIRKAFVNNKTKIFSIGDSGNLTYDYEIIGKSTEDLKNILEKKNKISEKILASKKPLFIIGESSLTLRRENIFLRKLNTFFMKMVLLTRNGML